MTLTKAVPAPVDSTLLASVMYDLSESTLQLEFRDGATYRYWNVPAAIHNGLLTADSKGSYFNRKIRNCFQYVRLRPPQRGSRPKVSSAKFESTNHVALGYQPALPG
jgi:hypothetical protein